MPYSFIFSSIYKTVQMLLKFNWINKSGENKTSEKHVAYTLITLSTLFEVIGLQLKLQQQIRDWKG